jgi:hypothetical protein
LLKAVTPEYRRSVTNSQTKELAVQDIKQHSQANQWVNLAFAK